MIIGLSSCNTHALKLLGDRFLCFLNSKSGKLLGIDQLAALSKVILLLKRLLGYVRTIDNLNHIDIVGDRILKVTLVMAWNSHNSTGSVACKNEISDKERHFLAVDRIDRIKSL